MKKTRTEKGAGEVGEAGEAGEEKELLSNDSFSTCLRTAAPFPLLALTDNFLNQTVLGELQKLNYPNSYIQYNYQILLPLLKNSFHSDWIFFIWKSLVPLVLLSKILWERLNRLKYSLMSHPVAWGICFGNLQHH